MNKSACSKPDCVLNSYIKSFTPNVLTGDNSWKSGTTKEEMEDSLLKFILTLCNGKEAQTTVGMQSNHIQLIPFCTRTDVTQSWMNTRFLKMTFGSATHFYETSSAP